MRTWLRGKFWLLFMTFAVLLAIPAIALADQIGNNVDATIDATVEQTNIQLGGPAGSNTKQVGYLVQPTNGDSDTGCNFDGATEKLVANVVSSNPSVATVSPSQVTFDGPGCGDTPSVTVTGVSAGTSTITLTQFSNNTGGTFDFATATFQVNVLPPPDSTPPVITKTVTGTLNNGWYTSNVGVDWTVSDSQSAISSQSGCTDFSVTSDQQATTYTCTATSAGGTSSDSVTIKRDATAPTNIQFVDGPNAGGSYAFGNVPNEPTCTATDATSTMDTCVVSGYSNAVGEHTLTATATDKAGNKTTATRTYTVNKAQATVNLSDLTQTYNGSPRAVTVATVPAGLNVDVTYDGNAQAPTNAGTYAVEATVNDNNYEGTASDTLTIEKAQATVNLSDLTQTYNGNPRAVTVATVPAGLNVDVTYDGNAQAPTNAGTYAVEATVNDNNYEGTASDTLTIEKAQATVNLSDLTQTYNGNPRAVTVATVPAGLNVDVTYDGNAQAPTNAGTYAVEATVNDNNYEGTASDTLTIEKAQATVNLSDLTQTYNGSPRQATVATVPAGLNVDVTYDGNAQAPTNAGTYAVEATVNDNNYEGTASDTLTIEKAQATVNLSDLTQTYNGSPRQATVATVPAGLNVDVTYDGNAQAPTNAGTYAVEATVNDNNYEGTASDTLTIEKAQATVNLSDLTQTYNGNPRAVTVATVPAGLNVDVTYDGNAQAPTNAGTYAVEATVNDNNYEGTASDTLTIEKAQATVNLSDLTQTYNGSPRQATVATVPAGLNVDVTYDGNAQAPTNAGTYAVEATVNDNNYEGTASDTLTIEKATQAINFAANTPTTKTFGDADFNVNATGGGSGNPVTFAAKAGSNCTVSNSGLVHLTGAGTCTIVASQAGNANYLAAPDKEHTIAISKATQAITFGPLSDKILGAADFNVSATGGGSGNPVTFTATGACTVTGNNVHITGVGTCTITASQAGNDNYLPAPNVSQSFKVTYNFLGFRSPVDNPGTGATPVYNSAKAGQSIPVKFSLSGNQGLNIISGGNPKVTQITCPNSTTAVVDPIEEYTTTANNGLTYDATADQYNYVWKTQSTYANKCFKFDMVLTDGTSHVAYFKFLK